MFSTSCVVRSPARSSADLSALLAQTDKEERALLGAVARYDDRPLGEYLSGVVARLAPDVGLEVAVVLDPTLNAFALPSGHIYVHTGLLSRLENEAQLAAVLAREVTHYARRHALAVGAADTPVTLDVRQGRVLGRTARAILGLGLRVAAIAAIEGYGRRLERAADAGGLEYLVHAGYDPGPAPRAFERLAVDLERRGALETFLLGRRRSLDERIESMRHLLTTRYATAPPSAARSGPDDFVARTRRMVRDNAREDVAAGRFGLAQEQLDRVLATTPTDPVAHLYYGDLWRLLSQRAPTANEKRALGTQALASYQRSIALDPAAAAPYRQLGLLYYDEKDVARAAEAFRRYLALRPDAPDAPRIAEYLATLER